MRYRNEWKYVCTEASLNALSRRLSGVLSRDEHTGSAGNYEVHSLYFDDWRNTQIVKKEAGVARRAKYRLRYYNDQVETLFLERKEKWNGYCRKEHCPLSEKQFIALIRGEADEVIWDTPYELLKRFCMHCMSDRMHPSAIIDYEREAFVDPIGNVRITIDRNISVAASYQGFLLGEYLRIPIQACGLHVLEVKFDDILPGYIRRAISDARLKQVSMSKYYLGRKMLQQMGESHGNF